MKSEKIIESVSAILRSYPGYEDISEEILKNPGFWQYSRKLPSPLVIGASLIAEAQQEIEKQSGSPIAAMKRIYRAASRDDMLGVWEEDGYTVACSGFHAVRLKRQTSGLPVVKGIPGIFKVYDFDSQTDRIELPSLATIKSFNATHGNRRGNKRPAPYDLGGVFVNPFFLIDVLECLPGAECRTKLSSRINPLIFSCEDGDGVLMPINK